MSVVHNELKGGKDGGGKWFLRKSGSDVFGPEELSTIAKWVEESRVVSGNEISQDKTTWTLVEDIPDFGMDWIAELPDGRRYGPFNIKASEDLHKHKVLPAEAVLVNRHSKDKTTVEDFLDGQHEPREAEKTPEDARQGKAADSKPAETSEETATEAKQEDPPAEKKKRKSAPEAAPKAAANKKARDPANSTVKEKQADTAVEGKASDTTVEEESTDTVDDKDPAGTPKNSEDEQDKEDSSSAVTEEISKLSSKLARSDKRAKDLKAKLEVQESENAQQLKDLQKARAEADAAAKKLSVLEEEAANMRTGDQQARKKIEAKFERELKSHQEKVSELEQLNMETSEKASLAEESLATAIAELKKARKAGESAQSNLKETESQQARKQAVQQKRLSDLLEERNHLAQVVELQTRRTSRLRFVVVVLIILSLAGIITLLVRRGKDDSEIATGKTLDEQLILEEDESGVAAEADVSATGKRRVPFPIIKAKGIEIFYNKSGCNIVFKEAFFSSGTTPSAASLEILKRIAPQMKRYSNQYHLIVEGHTDNRSLGSRSKYKSNYDLGMARAEAVTNLLTKDYRFSKSAVKATSAGSEDPPFSNGEETSRRKNMTVVLKLVRHVRI